MNPFEIPGASGKPNSPLRPWDEATREHEDFYVAVDGTQDAFETFQAERTDPAALTRGGWFVLVTGEPGCGKTSLVNRCVHWLDQKLAGCDIKAIIADVAEDAAENEDVDERMRRVCRRLATRWLAGYVSPDQKKLLDGYTAQPGDFYPLLSDVLDDRHVLIVLLPPSELIAEVREYAWWCRAKIVFFAESSFDEVATSANVLRVSDRTRLTRLAVHALREGDGQSFQADRMTRHDGRGPGVDKEAAERMVATRLGGLGTSIGQLQSLLYSAYEQARQNNLDRDIITYQYLCDYVVERALSLS